MHFLIDLIGGDEILITSYPMGGDERAYFRQKAPLSSEKKIFGMTVEELAGYSEIVTSNEDGSVISKTKRPETPAPIEGELPAWVRKRDA